MTADEETTTGTAQTGKLLAELVGTFALVFAGCGAIMTDAMSGALTHVGVALTFGLVVTVMIYAVGHVSGAHFNPAVTIAFAACGRFRWSAVPGYVLAQCLGAAAASGALARALGDVASYGATTPSGTVTQALGFEIVCSFMLMFVIISVATDHRAAGDLAGVAIGGTVALCALFAGPISGASMNPARSLGPALLAGDLSQLWIYIVGPVGGALAGASCYHALRSTKRAPGQAGGTSG